MRHGYLCLAFFIVSLGPNAARAADVTPKGKQGETTTPATSPGAGGPQSGAAVNELGLRRERGDEVFAKWWQIDAGWEFHALLIPYDIDHEGAGAAKLLNYGYVGARANVTRNNRISARMGMEIFTLADANESGVRASDLTVSYTRIQELPKGFVLRPSVSVLLPTSFASQHDTGLYFGIIPSVSATYRYKILTLDARVFGTGYVQHYRTALGGNPNPKGSVGFALAADVELPWWRNLSLGASFYDEYLFLYEPFDPTLATTVDKTYGGASQPFFQVYGVELYTDIRLPYWKHGVFDVHVAFAVGDPQLGYTSVLYDGASRIFGYGPTRITDTIYVALAAHF